MRKLIFFNIVCTIGFILTPSLSLFGYKLIKAKINTFRGLSFDRRANYPVFKNKDLSKKIFSEQAQLNYSYRSFIGWRREKSPDNFKYVTVHGLYNTRKSLGERLDNSNWFFGGSTMAGSGVSDIQTIPSIYSKKTNENVFNFGEGSWDSRQSLNQLISVIGDGKTPQSVIFYDGVNDVSNGCRKENANIPSHGYDAKLKKILKTKGMIKFLSKKIVEFIIKPYLLVSKKFTHDKSLEAFDCHENLDKANRIAQHQVNNWYSAYLISKDKGAKFFAILQPNLFTSNSKHDYFEKKDSMILPQYKKQFNAVYPLIINEVNKKCATNKDFCESFIDATDWTLNSENVYFDFCHLTFEGNQIIVDKLVKHLNTSKL